MVAREAGSAREHGRLVTKRTTYVRNVLSLPAAGRGRLALALGELFEVLEQLRNARPLARSEGGRSHALPVAGYPQPVVDEVAVQEVVLNQRPDGLVPDEHRLDLRVESAGARCVEVVGEDRPAGVLKPDHGAPLRQLEDQRRVLAGAWHGMTISARGCTCQGSRGARGRRVRRRAHARRPQNCTLRTASLILAMITSPSSWPWSVLKPFMAATTPAMTSATSRISATYSTVPWPRSPPSGLALKSAAWMRPNRRCMWVPPALRTAVGRHAAERRRTAPDASVKRD